MMSLSSRAYRSMEDEGTNEEVEGEGTRDVEGQKVILLRHWKKKR